MRTSKTWTVLAFAIVALLVLSTAATAQGVFYVKNNRAAVGDDNPTQARFTIKTDDGSGAGFKVSTTNATANFDWFFQQNAVTGAFLISNNFGGNAQVQIFPSQPAQTFVVRGGKVGVGTNNPQGKLDVRGSIVNDTTVHHADFVFEPDYELESIEEHAAYMWANKHLPEVGAGEYTDEGLARINITERSQAVLHELEKAHIYIEMLNNQVKDLNEVVVKQQALLEQISAERSGS